MNRFAVAAGMTWLLSVSSAFAQSDSGLNPAIAQNFQFINPPPPPQAAASAPTNTHTQSTRGHRHPQSSMNSGSTDAAQTQP